MASHGPGDESPVYVVPGDADCEHPSSTYLGGDTGNNDYYRCQSCEAVLVETGQRDIDRERAELEARERERRKAQRSIVDRFRDENIRMRNAFLGRVSEFVSRFSR